MPNARTRALRDELKVRRMFGAVGPRRKKLPQQLLPKGVEQSYTSRLLDVTDLVEQSLQPLLDILPLLIQTAAQDRQIFDSRFDAGEGRRVRELIEQAATGLEKALDVGALETIAAQFAQQTSTQARVQLGKQLRAGLGVDVFAGNAGLVAAEAAFVSENVALITNMPAKTLADIEGVVSRGIQAGKLHKDIAAEIEDQFRIGRNRARLIARDQVGKYYGKVGEQQQRTLGIDKFRWRTANDERVRPSHEALDDKVFSWSNPPFGGPGQPINCRCYAEPVLDDLLS